MDCRQAGPYIDPSIMSRMVRYLLAQPSPYVALLRRHAGVKQGHSSLYDADVCLMAP
jgi:hypothetical protein